MDSIECIDKLDFESDRLKTLVKDKEGFRSVVLHGREGVGKRARAYAILEALHGEDTNKIKKLSVPFYENKKCILNCFYTPFHLELDPSIYSGKDFQVLRQLVPIKKNMHFFNSKCPFYIYIIHNVDLLSSQAQRYLHYGVERGERVRFIFTTKNFSKLPNRMQNSLVVHRIRGPSKGEVKKIFTKMGEEYGVKVSKLAVDKILGKIVDPDNLKEAVYLFHLSYRTGKYMDYKLLWQECSESVIDFIKNGTVNEKVWLQLRELLIKLLLSSFTGTQLVKYIMRELIKEERYTESIVELVDLCARYENRMNGTGKDIVHLEALIIQLKLVLIKL